MTFLCYVKYKNISFKCILKCGLFMYFIFYIQQNGFSLQFQVRAKDAPVETAKFLGHGVCDHVTRSSTLSLGTEDKDVILR